jgi:hypothetical protein
VECSAAGPSVEFPSLTNAAYCRTHSVGAAHQAQISPVAERVLALPWLSVDDALALVIKVVGGGSTITNKLRPLMAQSLHRQALISHIIKKNKWEQRTFQECTFQLIH